MASVSRVQDLPPPGGYKPIPYKRVPAKTYFSGAGMIAGYLGITAGAAYLYWLTYRKLHIEEIEQRSAALALMPLLQAERDREFLKQMKRNRDEEAKLMANVEGWVVGTWYGEPIYTTVPKDYWVTPRMPDYYVHTDFKDYAKRAHFAFWS